MALMTDRRIRHLPVLENGEVSGVVSIGDLVKAIIAEQEIWIRELENHVLEHTSIV
jgi:IMP dehydrogenase